jgi:shikimate kinase
VRARRIVFLGLMGAGKSTVGRLVAARLAAPFVDNDDQVRVRTGRRAREVEVTDGLAALHEVEAAALRDALELPTPVVITAAASAVASNAELLAARAFTVWLRARPETLAARTLRDPSRPILPAGSDAGAARTARATLATQDRTRSALYERVADLVVDVDDRTPEDAADVVLTTLGVAG